MMPSVSSWRVSPSDILRIPRRTGLGRFLHCCQGFAGLGVFFAKLERVQRKRFLANLKGQQRQVLIEKILKHECGREFQAALEEWLKKIPSKTVPRKNPVSDIALTSSLRCSVIINTVDRSKDLSITLDSLRLEWDESQDELIVVLGPGDDDSEDLVRRSPLPVRLLHCSERNLAISRNIGLAAAVGRYVAFIDDDASPEKGWLNELLNPLEKDSRAAVSAGFVLDAEGRRFLNRYVVADTLGRAFWFEDEASASAKIDALGEHRAFLTATGCNMAFRRSVLNQVGGFDPAYAYFLEETDAVWGAIDAGFRCVSTPQSRVLHRLGPNVARASDFNLEKRMVLIRSQIHYIGKFGKATFPADEIRACLWERALIDLEKIAWDCASNELTAARCGSFQTSYLQAVSAQLRLDSSAD